MYLVSACWISDISYEGNGGGIFFDVESGNLDFHRNIIENCSCMHTGAYHGGGLFIGAVSECKVSFNCFTRCGANYGGAIGSLSTDSAVRDITMTSCMLCPPSRIYSQHTLRTCGGVTNLMNVNMSHGYPRLYAFIHLTEYLSYDIKFSQFCNSIQNIMFETSLSSHTGYMESSVFSNVTSETPSMYLLLRSGLSVFKNVAFVDIGLPVLMGENISLASFIDCIACGQNAIMPSGFVCKSLPTFVLYGTFECLADPSPSLVFSSTQKIYPGSLLILNLHALTMFA